MHASECLFVIDLTLNHSNKHIASGLWVPFFYPTALKGCRGIVFTHGVWLVRWASSGKKFVRAVSQKP